jgi:hypothetical protein
VHSTDAPLTISFRRAEMRALWSLSTVTLALILAIAASTLGSAVPWAWGAGALIVVLPGLVWPRWFEMGVSAWNKGVVLSTSLLRAYTLTVCYYLFFGSVSRAGSSLGHAGFLGPDARPCSRNARRSDGAKDGVGNYWILQAFMGRVGRRPCFQSCGFSTCSGANRREARHPRAPTHFTS